MEKINTREIKIKIRTKSNCLIGNQTESFAVGGVDQCTTMDEENFPMIPGSAIKGALRAIAKEMGKKSVEYEEDGIVEIKKYYGKYFENLKEEYVRKKTEFAGNIGIVKRVDKLIEDLEKYDKNIKAEYIFGIEGFNEFPKLYFTDFKVVKEDGRSNKDYFLIDSKTSIDDKGGEISSNPRTYKVVKPNVSFTGSIYFKGFENYEGISFDKIVEEVKSMMEMFNTGFYSIGNSKSRGYGRIEVEVI